ncbi:MAG: class B sortase [Oscillospiraceae bacterium]|nr:class B sortase [Oscillospiraceae bacterium]
MDKKKTIIAVCSAVVVFAAAAAGIAFLNRKTPVVPDEPVTEVTEAVTEVPVTEPVTEPVTTFKPFVNGLSLKAQEWKNDNPDTVGWIRIQGTAIDYAVTRTDNNDYYVDRDFWRNYDSAGWVFMDFRCGIESNYFTDNTLIYAHNMASGVMFADLKNYERYESFYEEHPIIELSSLSQDYQFKIFAFMPCNGVHGSDFEFWNYTFFSRGKEPEWTLGEYLSKIDDKSLITTKVDLREDDKYLALSTCYGGDTTDPTRFVVLARMVRPGEDALEGTTGSVRRW